ncbi:MAG: DUF87 domain-containing protein [Phycisphaerae bacterium]|jgi:hypothetical protein
MKNMSKNIAILLKNRFVIFSLFFATFVVVQYFAFGTFFPSANAENLWFYSGIFMVLFSMLFIEPYYTSPKNVITSAIPLLLVFLAIKTSLDNQIIWWTAVIVLLLLLFASIIAMALEDKNKSSEHLRNKTSTQLKDIVVLIGQGKVLYSAVFIYFLLTYYSIQNIYTVILFALWCFIVLINPKNIHNTFSLTVKREKTDQIGEIFGVQSKKVFLAKLFEDRKSIKKFDIVKFRYSMQDADDLIITGIVFDTYLLNQEKWAKILQLADPKKEASRLKKNIVYKLTDSKQAEIINKELKVDDFVGVVIEGSTIGKIKFEYSKKQDDLQEGDLLECEVGEKRLFYQVIEGSTEKEKLEAQNETGFIEGKAIQLGEWQNNKLSFQKFGWVPSINIPLFKADTSDIQIDSFAYPSYKLGVIPGTSLPSVINLDDAISHHMALLGVTGSGKSFICREIIKELKTDTKIICVDLTGEWKERLSELSPAELINAEGLKAVEAEIAKKETAGKKGDKTNVLEYKKGIQKKLNGYIESFAISDNNITIFELPDLSNTSFILEFTQLFLDGVFLYAKENSGKKFCIVLEEAHTVIPETTFLGDLGDYSSNKGLVSKMGQLVLQGRKYGVGFLVIAQRTANVSKTVLTQCNSVICFQAFDETSFTFLGNYVGKDMVQTLPNLKQYHAVVAGKAFKSNMPMIVDLTRVMPDQRIK